MSKLQGKVALVSGSGRGIGQAIALKLASEGARLVVNDLDEGPAAETVGRPSDRVVPWRRLDGHPAQLGELVERRLAAEAAIAGALDAAEGHLCLVVHGR